jgi:S1-C subfamily serine protease
MMFRLLCTFLLLCAPASAQQIRVFYSSGTGFFVSEDGWLITNAHVIRNCVSAQVELHGAVEAQGQIMASDPQRDLALIHTRARPGAIAHLSQDTSTVRPGEQVMVMGYPQEAAQQGEYSIVMAEVLDDKGPGGEPYWLQFTSSAQQGNSGGPLLDSSGHVIGVVTGKTDIFEVDERMRTRTHISTSDIAVTLPVLKQFLERNGVRYTTRYGGARRADNWKENRARQFIINVRCVTGEEVS